MTIPKPSHVGRRFSLKALLVCFAGSAVGCTVLFVLLPDLWSLATETPLMRNTLATVLGLTGVVFLILAVSVAARLVMLAVTGMLERPADE